MAGAANLGTATRTKDHPSEKLCLAVGGNPPEPIGDAEQDCRENPGRSEAVEHRTSFGSVLE